jgi:type IV pilus assembly protein PilB
MDKIDTKTSSVTDVTEQILAEAATRRASDVFIEPLEKELQVRLRIDGILHQFLTLPLDVHSKIVTRIKVIGNLDIAEHRLAQDGSFKMKIAQRAIDFRISVMPTRLGEKVVLRLLDRQNLILDLEKLGLDADSVGLLRENLKKPHGMVIVCGPTGCGKTSTLYACLKSIDSIDKNIVTVEDPIEYQLYGINQVAVNEAYGLTFASVLRSILRQDPNIILVGEIRDTETAEIAIRAALTGHLVLSSLHTTTSTGSIIRLVNMGVEPFLISSSVLLVASQALLRLLCSECKEPRALPNAVALELEAAGFKRDSLPSVIYKPKGCAKCNQAGYWRRTAVMESLGLSSNIRELIEKNASEKEIRTQAKKEGMRTLRENALGLLVKGLTSMEEIARLTASD